MEPVNRGTMTSPTWQTIPMYTASCQVSERLQSLSCRTKLSQKTWTKLHAFDSLIKVKINIPGFSFHQHSQQEPNLKNKTDKTASTLTQKQTFNVKAIALASL